MNDSRISKIVGDIENYKKRLFPFKDLINIDDFSSLESMRNTFESDAKSKENSNRLLRIGIIGQIKRGKSSFLNALIFDGKDILPKGATPMTAALTRVVYADKPYAKLTFYTVSDWKSIEAKALEAKAILDNDDSSESLAEEDKACIEIYEKANSAAILEKLGESEILDGINKVEDLLEKLEGYVGADGKYTPIVKSLELGVNIVSMKDIEIVDTPGTNDPVVSRGRVTQEFIGQCDVVFFLSSCSQFLDQNDMQILAQNMPSKGVENIFLVGSLFDSAMVDEYDHYENAADLIKTLKYKYTQRAEEEIVNKPLDESIKQSLSKALPPIFISGMCYNIAKNFENLSEEEKFYLDNLNSMYGDNFEPDDMMYIANIEEAGQKIEKIKEQKEEILNEAFQKVIDGLLIQREYLSKKIKDSVTTNFELFQNSDIESLEKKQKIIKKSIENGKIKIDNLFESYIIGVEKDFAKLRQSLRNESKNAGNVKIESGIETENYSVSTSKWYNPFSWGSSETKTRTINYKYANVYDAIEQLEEFVRTSEHELSKSVENIIDIPQFRKDIMKNIVGLFDVEDDDFNPLDIIDTLKNAVDRISIPNIDIDTSVHIDTIRNNFSSSEVRESEIDSLKKETKRILSLILKDMEGEITTQTTKISKDLIAAKNDFIPKLLNDTIEKLETMKKNRLQLEKTEERYHQLLKIIG